MNRFDMLTDRHKNKPVAYKFKPTSSPVKVFDYLKICMEDAVSLDASNIYPSTIDRALLLLQTEIKIPVITKLEKSMRVLRLSGLKKVHTIDSLPEGILRAVCYWDLNAKEIPKDVEIALIIQRNNESD